MASVRRGYSKEAVHREEDIKNYRESWSREQPNRIGALDLFEALQSNHLLKIGNFPARENIFSSAASRALIADQQKRFLRKPFFSDFISEVIDCSAVPHAPRIYTQDRRACVIVPLEQGCRVATVAGRKRDGSNGEG